MLDFNTYLMRHGEPWIQDILERIERNEGIRHESPVPLEDRWEALMRNYPVQTPTLAA
ncbi:MAG: hypothetical protein PHX43_09545 [Alphaproteobacteria bacterium]|nr:hypothetical protein [Alphaproteobacteria bacterium]